MTVIEKLKEAIISERWDIVMDIYVDFGGNPKEIAVLTMQEEQKAKPKAKKVKPKSQLSDKLNTEELISEKNIEIALSEPVIKRRSDDDFLSPIKGNASKNVNNGTGRFDKDGNEIRIAYSEPLDISKSKINLFEDDLSIATKDIEFDKKVITKSPVRRNTREDALEINAVCKSCGRTDKVLPMFAQHYRCSRCMVATR